MTSSTPGCVSMVTVQQDFFFKSNFLFSFSSTSFHLEHTEWSELGEAGAQTAWVQTSSDALMMGLF